VQERVRGNAGRRRRWRRARTPLAVVANVAAFVAYAVVVQRIGFFDLRAHRALQYKVIPVVWPVPCLLVSGAGVHRLRVARLAGRQGRPGQAVGLASTGRDLLHVSTAMFLTPVVLIGALILYLLMLPINGL